MKEISDEQLVREFKKGSLKTYDCLVQKHQDRIYRLTCLWLRNGDQAEDATQEVFLRAFKGLRGFRFGASPFTWLYRTQSMYAVNTTENKYLKISMNPLKFLAIGLILS